MKLLTHNMLTSKAIKKVITFVLWIMEPFCLSVFKKFSTDLICYAMTADKKNRIFYHL